MKPVLLQLVRRNDVAIGRPEVGCHGTVPLPVDGHDAAEQLGLGQQLLVAMDVARVRAALVADLEEFAGFALGKHHAAGALERVRHLLFAVHVLAGLQARNRVRRVPEIGRRDDDRVELFLLVEHLAVVFVAVGLLLEPLEGVDDAPLVVIGPDVTHRAEAQARDAKHRLHQHLALSPGAEQGDVDLLQTRRGDRSRGCRLLPAPSVLLLAAPRVAEEPERRDRGQPHEQIAPIELWRPFDLRARLPLALFVLASSHHSSPVDQPKYTRALTPGPGCPEWGRRSGADPPRPIPHQDPAGPRPPARDCARTALRSPRRQAA